MPSSLLAKIFGWTQFATSIVGQLASSGTPHGWGWLAWAGSLAGAIGIHHASSTDGAK